VIQAKVRSYSTQLLPYVSDDDYNKYRDDGNETSMIARAVINLFILGIFIDDLLAIG
jgi:hypothetical protein